MKKLVISLLLLLAIPTTTVGAYWAYTLLSTNESNNATVTIGKGETLQTTLNVNDQASNDTLVPAGYGTHQTTISFDLLWNATTGAKGDVTVTIESITLGDLTEQEILEMFSFTFDETFTITHDSLTPFDLLISFDNEPLDRTIYDQVANQDLIITLNFMVQPS